jgi:hypothetical protein
MISVNGVPRTKLSVFIRKGRVLIPTKTINRYYEIEFGTPPRIKAASSLGAAYYAYAHAEGLALESLATHPLSASNRVGQWLMGHYNFTLQDLINLNALDDSYSASFEGLAQALEDRGL